jgi:hypothetical protein
MDAEWNRGQKNFPSKAEFGDGIPFLRSVLLSHFLFCDLSKTNWTEFFLIIMRRAVRIG